MNRYEQLFHVRRALGNASIWEDERDSTDMVIALILEGERAAVNASLCLRDDNAVNIDHSGTPRLVTLDSTNTPSLLKNAVTQVQYRVSSDWPYERLAFSTKEAILGDGLSLDQNGFPKRWYLDLEAATPSIGLWPVPYSDAEETGNVLIGFVTTPSADDLVYHTGTVDVENGDKTVTGQATNNWTDYLQSSDTATRYFGVMSTAEGLPSRWQAVAGASPSPDHSWDTAYTFELSAAWAGQTEKGKFYVITANSGLDRYEESDSAAIHFAAARLKERRGEDPSGEYALFERAVSQLQLDSGFNDLPEHVRQQASPVAAGA